MGRGIYICPTCGKDFPFGSKLAEHMIGHSEERVHKCPDCDKSYKHKRDLKIHQNTHIYGREFVCDICGASFTRKYTLNNHMFIHSAERFNKCPQCMKYFKTKCDLRKHEKLHTDAKMFFCDICGKSFKTKYYLDSHKVVHSIEEQPSCSESKKSSEIKSHFDQHVQLHTKHKNPIYEKCLVSCNNVSSIRPVIGTLSEEKQQNSDISRRDLSIPDNIIHHSRIYVNPINYHENIIQIEKPVVSNHEQMFLQEAYKYELKQTSAPSSFQTQVSNTFRTEAKSSIERQTSCVVLSLPFDETKQRIGQTCESSNRNILPFQISSSRPDTMNSNDLHFMEETNPWKYSKNSTKFTNIQCVDSPQQEMNEYSSQTLSVHENSSTSDAQECQTVCDVIIQSFSLDTDWEQASYLNRETLDPFP